MSRESSSAHGSDFAGRPLRIAMISYYLPSGSKIGVGYQAHEIANELVRRGHTVDMISACPPVAGALYGHRQVELSGAMRTFRFANRVRSIDYSTYDVIHAHGDDYLLRGRDLPFHIRTMHGSCFEEAIHIKGVKERVRMFALGLTEVVATLVADRTVLVSPQTRRWTPWVRLVVPNGVDLSRFATKSEPRADHPVVLFVGTWLGRKRGRDLAEQFAQVVLPQMPRARLHMVTQDAPADVPDGVVVMGRLNDEDLIREYQRAWVFCLPSSYEGFGIPYAEAMASGTPVVATANLGARFVTQEGRFGVLTSIPHLGTELLRLLGADEERARLAAAGSERAAYFALERVVDEYLRLYRPA